jgi:NADH-quinone oxidoreductase subunit F
MSERRGAVSQSPTVRVCSSAMTRPEAVLDAAREVAEETHVVEVGPVGIPRFEPLVIATNKGQSAFHPNTTESDVQALVEVLEDGESPIDGAHAVVEHDPEPTALPLPEDGPLSVGKRLALARCGWVAPASIEDYESEGGLVSERVGPDEAFDQIEEIGVRGRGRGDGSTDSLVTGTWETVRATPGAPVVVINANEADEHARMDPLLLEGAPIDVIDAARLVAEIVDTPDIVVYLGDRDDLARERVEAAGDAVEREFGEINVQTASGPDEYMAGEMTMALESLEGNDRLEARRRPPGPAEHGLFSRPTVIHTPRTFAQIRAALENPEAFDTDETDPGTRIFTVAGDVSSPATVELPTDDSLETAFDAVLGEGGFKAACIGGVFGGVTRDVRVAPAAGSLRSSNLGTNGIIERLNHDRCMVAFAGKRAKFAREGNCGRCVPGREGTKQLVSLLREIYDGKYEVDMLHELARVMRRSSICDFGKSASRPVTTAMDEFGSEFHAHTEGYCPAGFCEERAGIDRTEPRRPESTTQ